MTLAHTAACWTIQVCDLGLARIMEDQAVASSVAATNPRWLAPEILEGQGATFASDVYGYGIIMWELLTFEIPWPSSNTFQIVKDICDGLRPPIPDREKLPGDGASFAGRIGHACNYWCCRANRVPWPLAVR